MDDKIDMLGGAIVMVSNQQRALEFYSKKIGFEVKENEGDDDDESSNRWIEVRPKNSGAPIILVDPDKENGHQNKKNKQKKNWYKYRYMVLLLKTFRLHIMPSGKGVKITLPEKQPWGVMMFVFTIKMKMILRYWKTLN